MRILVVGASGFIGRHLTARLLVDGHQVVGCVRDAARFKRMFADAEAIESDLAADVDDESWLKRLDGVDAVANLAGVMAGSTMHAIHVAMPKALLRACSLASIDRFVHVSAISAAAGARTDYATLKLAGEDLVRGSDLDWVVLRPSLVYSEGSRGGTSVLRGLAAFPFVVPVPGRGAQEFSPIHVDDLCEVMLRALDGRIAARSTLMPAGPDKLTLAEIARRWRRWLGLADARLLPIPLWLVTIFAPLADVLGLHAMGRNALRQLEFGNAGDGKQFAALAGFAPASFEAWLAARPAHAQERWHARLVFLRPLLRLGLAGFWLALGASNVARALPVLFPPVYETAEFLPPALDAAPFLAAIALALGVALLARWRPTAVAIAQLAATAALPLLGAPSPASHAGDALLVLPLLLAIAAWIAIEDER
jgi:uncharacterized protein YbjT (DUF2867 family)